MNEDIIGLLDFARSGAAERADGRGERKHPYRRADRNAVERREVDIYRLDRHFPTVHAEAPATAPKPMNNVQNISILRAILYRDLVFSCMIFSP